MLVSPELRPDVLDDVAESRIWATGAFLKIGNLLGETRVQRLLADYVEYLERARLVIGAKPCEPRLLRQTLHDMRSTSGVLGFEALSDICLIILSDSDQPSSAMLSRLLDLTCRSLDAAKQHLGACAGMTVAA